MFIYTRTINYSDLFRNSLICHVCRKKKHNMNIKSIPFIEWAFVYVYSFPFGNRNRINSFGKQTSHMCVYNYINVCIAYLFYDERPRMKIEKSKQKSTRESEILRKSDVEKSNKSFWNGKTQ